MGIPKCGEVVSPAQWRHEWTRVGFTVNLPRLTVAALETMSHATNQFPHEVLDDLIWRAYEYHEAGERLPTHKGSK